MLAKVVLVASAFFGFVAAEVAPFTATDDYDELNLNIRLLANHSEPVPSNSTEMTNVEVVVSLTFSEELTESQGTTVCTEIATSAGGTLAEGGCSYELVRRLSEKRRTQEDGYTYTFTVTIAVPASMAESVLATVNDASFTAALGTALTTALPGVTTTVNSVSATEVADAPAPTAAAPTAAPTPAPASKKDSSNASMMSVNVAFVAVASMVSFLF